MPANTSPFSSDLGHLYWLTLALALVQLAKSEEPFEAHLLRGWPPHAET